MSWLSGQVLVKDHSEKKKKYIYFSAWLPRWQKQVLGSASRDAHIPSCLQQLLWNHSLTAKLCWGTGKSEGHPISSLYPPWCFLTWKSTKLGQGSWKRDCVIMEMVVPAPSIQISWVGLAEVIRSLKMRKVVFILILAAVLTFRVHEILNAHLRRLFRGTEWYNHKPKFTFCSENTTSLFLVALYLSSMSDMYQKTESDKLIKTYQAAVVGCAA